MLVVMISRTRRQVWLAIVATVVAISSPLVRAAAQAPAPITVEKLLTDGWEIAAYGSPSLDARSFILFKHRDYHYLVQCSVLFDVLRTKRVVTNCYEVH